MPAGTASREGPDPERAHLVEAEAKADIGPLEAARSRDRARFPVVAGGPSTWARLCPTTCGFDRLAAFAAALDAPEVRDSLEADEREGRYPAAALAVLRAAGLAEVFADSGEREARATFPDACAVAALLAERSGSLGITVGVNLLALLPVFIGADTELFEAVCTKVRNGDFAALLLTELDHGSDLLAIDLSAEGVLLDGEAFRAAAPDETPSHFRLRGAKDLINGGQRHEILVVLARTRGAGQGGRVEPIGALGDFSLLVTSRGPGVQGASRWTTLPMPAADISGVTLDGVVAPANQVIGAPGKGFRLIRNTLACSRGGIASLAAGTVTRARRLAVGYARRRTLYAAPLLRLGPVAEHAMRLEALDRVVASLALHAALAVSLHGWGAKTATAAAKLAGCALAERAVDEGARLLGARALLRELPFAQLIADVRLYGVFDGTSHVIAEELAGLAERIAIGFGGEGARTSGLGDLLAMYAHPPTTMRGRLRKPCPEWVLPLPAIFRDLDGLGAGRLEPLARGAEALLKIIRTARATRAWAADAVLRARVAQVYAKLEALAATALLADPDRRRATGLPPPQTPDPLDRCASRFAMHWLGLECLQEASVLALQIPADQCGSGLDVDLSDAILDLLSDASQVRSEFQEILASEAQQDS